MSFIPPNSKDPVRPSPVPDSLLTKPKEESIDFSSSSDQYNLITFSENFISKWFIIGPNGIVDEFPPPVKFVPASPWVLMSNDFQKARREEEERARWLLVAEKLEEDLVFAYEQAKTAMEENQHVLRLVARFGKILFYGRQVGPLAECSRRNLKKMFSTDVPASKLQHIKSKVVPSHGFSIDLEKETYTVKISHNTRPNANIICKCTLKEDGRLSMYKASLMPSLMLFGTWLLICHALIRVFDMRLLLAAKRKMTSLTEKEISDIKELLDSATVDPNVKGGLRWPLGKASSGDGYTIFEVCHVRATIYKNQTLRLRVRETVRSYERTVTGAVKREVTLILKDLNTKLQEKNIERGFVLEMLRDVLGTIWDFMHCDASSLT